MNLRKTESGQGATKLKPPKFEQELSFLINYITDEEQRRSNLSSGDISADSDLEEEREGETSGFASQIVSVPSPSPTTTDTIGSSAVTPSSIRPKNKSKKSQSTPETMTAASVLQQYLSQKDTLNALPNHDHLTDFFINMANTVKHFPLRDQIVIKK